MPKSLEAPVARPRGQTGPIVVSPLRFQTKTAPLDEQLRERLRKPLRETNVEVDFPRLAPKISVVDDAGKELFNGSHTKHSSVQLLMRDILEALAIGLQEDDETILHIKTRFLEYVDPGSRERQPRQYPICSFLEQELGASHVVTTTLKTCDQGSIARAATELRRHMLPRRVNYKDMKDGWKIIITIPSSLENEVVVLHRRTEQSWPSSTTNNFTFTWEFKIFLKMDSTEGQRTLSVSKAFLHIVNVAFSEGASDSIKTCVSNAVAEFCDMKNSPRPETPLIASAKLSRSNSDSQLTRRAVPPKCPSPS